MPGLLREVRPVAWGPVELGEPGARPAPVAGAVAAVEACLAVPRETPAPPGFPELRFEVRPDGTVVDLHLATHLRDDPLNACLLAAGQQLGPFPADAEDRWSVVRWPVAVGG